MGPPVSPHDRVHPSHYIESLDWHADLLWDYDIDVRGLYIRLWRTTTSFRNLEVIPISLKSTLSTVIAQGMDCR
jgi:hypothetical protein